MATTTIKLGSEYLTDDSYKMLTEEAKQKISEINDNVNEETIIELPDGLLFLNLLESDVDKWNAKILIQVPPSILGYMVGIPYNLLLPSFLDGTNLSDNGYGRDFYKCKLPKREFRILGESSDGAQFVYKSVQDENEARELTEEDFYEDQDHCYAAIPITGEYNNSNCWKLVFNEIEFGLYSDDAQSDICVDVEGADDQVVLIHAAYYALFEEEVGGCAAVMVKCVEDASVSDDEAICSDIYDPRLLKKLGCSEINGGVWTLRYDDRDVDWSDCCVDDPSFYYCDGESYSEYFEADETENEEDIPSGSEESDSDDATESVGDNGCISNKKTNLFDIINDKLRNRWGLEGSADATTETSSYCRECGTKLEPGDAFCGNCGAKIK